VGLAGDPPGHALLCGDCELQVMLLVAAGGQSGSDPYKEWWSLEFDPTADIQAHSHLSSVSYMPVLLQVRPGLSVDLQPCHPCCHLSSQLHVFSSLLQLLCSHPCLGRSRHQQLLFSVILVLMCCIYQLMYVRWVILRNTTRRLCYMCLPAAAWPLLMTMQEVVAPPASCPAQVLPFLTAAAAAHQGRQVDDALQLYDLAEDAWRDWQQQQQQGEPCVL